jgi:hypothetical protein
MSPKRAQGRRERGQHFAGDGRYREGLPYELRRTVAHRYAIRNWLTPGQFRGPRLGETPRRAGPKDRARLLGQFRDEQGHVLGIAVGVTTGVSS